jgi:hypothetical protein
MDLNPLRLATKPIILYFSTMQSPQNNHKRNWNSDVNMNWKWQTCVDNERGTIGVDGT